MEGVGRPTKSALESRVEWGIERGGGETSRIFCSKAKFPTNISAEKEFLRRQRINQAMMKGRREKKASLGPYTYDVCTEGEGGGCLISDQRKGGCVDLVLTRGGRGSKIPEN